MTWDRVLSHERESESRVMTWDRVLPHESGSLEGDVDLGFDGTEGRKRNPDPARSRYAR